MSTIPTQSRHTSEALARKAARRHGRTSVRIIEGSVPATAARAFYVETGKSLLASDLWPGERLVYQGEGRKA